MGVKLMIFISIIVILAIILLYKYNGSSSSAELEEDYSAKGVAWLNNKIEVLLEKQRLITQG